jgi:hypothetical protein
MYQLQGYAGDSFRHAKTGAKSVGIHQYAGVAGVSCVTTVDVKSVGFNLAGVSAPDIQSSWLNAVLHSSVRQEVAACALRTITNISNREAEA